MKFDKNGTRVKNDVFLQQYRRINNTSVLSRVTFCIIDSLQNSTFSYLRNESNASVWPGSYKWILLQCLLLAVSFYSGGVPPDGELIKEFNGVHCAITVIYVTVTITGIVFATGCFVFNFIFRKRKLVTCNLISRILFLLWLSISNTDIQISIELSSSPVQY